MEIKKEGRLKVVTFYLIFAGSAGYFAIKCRQNLFENQSEIAIFNIKNIRGRDGQGR